MFLNYALLFSNTVHDTKHNISIVEMHKRNVYIQPKNKQHPIHFNHQFASEKSYSIWSYISLKQLHAIRLNTKGMAEGFDILYSKFIHYIKYNRQTLETMINATTL